MKNHRDICAAKDAGSIHYHGLPGQIKTGCMASPAHKSRFCVQHSPQSCDNNSEGADIYIYMHLYVCI